MSHDTFRSLIARNQRAGWAFFDQSLVSLSNFVSVYLLARFMAVEAFGVFTLAYTGLLLCVSMQQAGITQPHNVLGAKRTGLDYRRFTSVLGLVQLGLSSACAALLVGVGLFMEYAHITSFGPVLVALGLLLIPWMAQEYVRRVLYTRQESQKAFVNDLVSYGMQALGVVGLILLHMQPDTVHVLYLFAVSSLAATLLGLWQLRGLLLFSPAAYDLASTRIIVSEVWGFGKWLTGSRITQWFGKNGHTWLLGIMVGAAPLGGYKAASHLVNVLNPIQQAAYAYLPSRASAVYEEEGASGLNRWLLKTGLLLLVPFTLMVIGLIVLSDFVLQLAYGDKFTGMGLEWIIILGAVAHLFNFTGNLFQTALMAMEESQSVFVASLISVGLITTVGVGLIYFFGIWGAAISKVVIVVVLLLYYFIKFSRLNARSRSPVNSFTPSAESSP